MKKRILSMILLAALALSCLVMPAAATASAVAESRNGVVRVLSLFEADLYVPSSLDYYGTLSGYATGSAFGVGTAGRETDTFVTNRHVVTKEDGLTEYQGDVYYAKYRFTGYYILLDSYAYNTETRTLDTSRAVPCTVICLGETDDADVAVLRAAETVPGRVALPLLGDEGSLQVTDRVSTLGYPGASDSATSESYLLADIDDVTVNGGEVSRFYDSMSVTDSNSGALTGHLIQHNAIINGGNSGGPLLDQNGAVVGINTYTFHGGDQAVSNSYYALRIKYAKDALDSLDIPYDLYKPGLSPLVFVAIGAAVLLAAAAAFLLLRKKKKPAAQGTAPQNSSPAAPAELRLQGESGAFAGRRFAINGQLRIGRDPGSNDLVYPGSSPGISGRHCLVNLAGGQLTLTDLGSSYGTFLPGGQRLTPNQPVTLHIGDRFSLGSDKETFVITGKGGSLT